MKQVVVNGGLSLCSRWLHVKISREETEKLLQPPMDGLFLIRPSIRHPGDYTLSVSYSSGVEHYRIKYKGNRFTIDDDIFFCNLEELVKVKPHLSRQFFFLSHRFAVTAFFSLLIFHLLQAVQRPPQPRFQWLRFSVVRCNLWMFDVRLWGVYIGAVVRIAFLFWRIHLLLSEYHLFDSNQPVCYGVRSSCSQGGTFLCVLGGGGRILSADFGTGEIFLFRMFSDRLV